VGQIAPERRLPRLLCGHRRRRRRRRTSDAWGEVRGALLGVLMVAAVDQGTSSRAVHPRSSPRCIRLALLGLTCEAPPAPSSVAMDLKAPRPASIAAALGLKPRRLMRSAADLDAGVEVEPGQRRLTGGRRARFPAVEESQPDPVGRTPRPGRRQPRTAHQRLRNAVLGAVCTGISGRLDPSGHDCLP
jgi:hypothetical protein